MDMEINGENFETEVISSEIPVLLDFRAVWCGPCAMIAPIISEIYEKYKDKLKVGKINIDKEIALTMKYSVTSVPTLIMIVNGEETERLVGLASFQELDDFVSRNIG